MTEKKPLPKGYEMTPSGWEGIKPNVSDLIIARSQLHLDSLTQAYRRASNRSYQLLSLQIILVSAAVGFLTSFKDPSTVDILFYVFILLTTFLSFGFIIRNLFAYSTKLPGGIPSRYYRQSFLSDYPSLVRQVLMDIEDTFKFNDKVLDRRLWHVNRAQYCLMSIVPASFFYLIWILV